VGQAERVGTGRLGQTGTGPGGLRYEFRIRHEGDLDRARRLAERQNEAIWELLR
jgi:hypothetical protein